MVAIGISALHFTHLVAQTAHWFYHFSILSWSQISNKKIKRFNALKNTNKSETVTLSYQGHQSVFYHCLLRLKIDKEPKAVKRSRRLLGNNCDFTGNIFCSNYYRATKRKKFRQSAKGSLDSQLGSPKRNSFGVCRSNTGNVGSPCWIAKTSGNSFEKNVRTWKSKKPSGSRSSRQLLASICNVETRKFVLVK